LDAIDRAIRGNGANAPPSRIFGSQLDAFRASVDTADRALAEARAKLDAAG